MATCNPSPLTVDKPPAPSDCEFVELPPKSFQHECPICLQVLQEPFQATCCGYSFCHTCIERVKVANKACPMCNEQEFEIFHNKGLQRSLHEFKVYCSHKKDGCEWTGELGDLKKHLSNDGCKFIWLHCAHCDRYVQSLNLDIHEKEHCPQRPFTCEHCNEYKATFIDVTDVHVHICPKVRVSCPRRCGVEMDRRDLLDHDGECPFALITCDFSSFGCATKLPRKDMAEHNQTSLAQHLSMLAVSHTKLSLEHATLKVELQQKTEELRDEQMKAHIVSRFCVPVTFTIKNFQQLRAEWKTITLGPFYSRPQGYKMVLRVSMECKERGGIWFCCQLVKGEYDDLLEFPVSMNVLLCIKYEDHDLKCDFSYRTGKLKRVFSEYGREGSTSYQYPNINFSTGKEIDISIKRVLLHRDFDD